MRDVAIPAMPDGLYAQSATLSGQETDKSYIGSTTAGTSRYRMSAAEYRSIKDELSRLESRISKGEAETDEYRKKTEYLRSNIQAYRLDELFTYHAPNEDQKAKYQWLRQSARDFAGVVLANTPEGADQSEALRLIRTALMTANAAIALNGLS